MGKASISISITSSFDPKGFKSAQDRMLAIAASAVSAGGTIGKSFVDAGNATIDAGSRIGIAGEKIEAAGRKMTEAGAALTMGVTVPTLFAAKATADAAIKIDTAWYGVRKTVDATEKEYGNLKQAAIDLSKQQPVSAETILNVMELGGQLGISKNNLIDFSRVISGLDIATNLGADTAALQLSQFMNITKASQDTVSNLGSTIVHLGNNTAATEADIMQMSLKLASAGSQAGMSDAQIMGLSASLASMGMKAEAGGSALSKVINSISAAVATGSDDLTAFAEVAGMSAEDFKAAWEQDAAKAFAQFVAGIADSGENAQVILDELGITEIRTSDAMRRLAGNAEHLTSVMDMATTAYGENNALTREVEERNKSLASRFEVLKNRVIAVANDVGGPLCEAALAALDAAEPLFSAIEAGAKAFSEMDVEQQRSIISMGAMAAAAGPVLMVGGKIVETFGKGVSAAGKLTSGIGRTAKEYGVYQEALKTTDDAMIRSLANSESLVVKKGLERNAMVQAAGGIDEYVAKSNLANEAQKKASKMSEKAVAANDAAAKAAQRYAEKVERQNRMLELHGKSSSQYKNAVDVAARANDNAAKKTLEASKAALEASDAQRKAQKALELTTDGTMTAAQAQEALGKSAKNAGKFTSDFASKMADGTKNMTLMERASASLDAGVAKASGAVLNLGQTIKGALLANAPMLAMTALAAAIAAVAAAAAKAKEDAERYTEATDGLKAAASDVSGIVAYNGEIVETGIKAQEAAMNVEELAKANAEAAQSIRDANAEAESQIGKFSGAMSVIEECAGKTDLSAEATGRLEWALKLVNDEFGLSIDKVDVMAGRYVDADGKVRDLVSSIGDLIEKKKQEIQLHALEESLTTAYKARADAAASLAKAQSYYNEQYEDFYSFQVSQGVPATTAAANAAEHAGAATRKAGYDVDKLTEAYESADASCGILESRLGNLASAVDGSADAYAQWASDIVSKSPVIAETFTANGSSIEAFAEDLRAHGADMKAFSELGEAELKQLAAAYKGEFANVEDALSRFGVSMGNAATTVDVTTSQWAMSFSQGTQSMIYAASVASGQVVSELEKTASQAGIKGELAVQAYAMAIRNGTAPEDAAQIASKVQTALDNAGELDETGRVAMQAYAQALLSGESEETAKQVYDNVVASLTGNGEVDEAGAETAKGYAEGFQNEMTAVSGIMEAASADAAKNTTNAFAGTLAEGVVDVQGAVSALATAASNPSAYWAAVEAARASGFDIPDSLANSIRSRTGSATEATRVLMFAMALQLNGGDVKAAAQQLGYDIPEGLRQAIEGNADAPVQASELMSQEVIDAAKSTFDSHSPSLVFDAIGRDLDAGLQQGVDGGADGPKTAVQTLGQSLLDAISGLPEMFGLTGSDAGANMASGIGSNAPNAQTEAQTLYNVSSEAVMGLPDLFAGYGTSASSKYATGVGSSKSTAATNAKGLYDVASNATSGIAAALGGYGSNASRLYASGVAASRGAAATNAKGLYDAANNATKGIAAVVGGYGRNASSGYSSGLMASYGAAVANASSMANAAKGMNAYSGSASTWGSHLSSNFASGIAAGIGWVRTAAQNIANAAKSILGFSVPEAGPWSGAERGGYTSGLHMVQNIAAGMDAGASEVARSAMRVSEAMSPKSLAAGAAGLSAAGGRGPVGDVVNNYYYTVGDVTLDASSVKDFMTVEDFFNTVKRAKEMV